MNEAMPILNAVDLSIAYGSDDAVKKVSLPILEKKITAIIGPSGCGKSTLLRSLNRMNDFIDGVSHRGQILYRGSDLYAEEVDPVEARLRIGMVFQKANPFPKSIFRNVAWGPSINHLPGDPRARVETALKQAALWDEVSDRLDDSALNLSGGQQQRICIARALAANPDLIICDEVTSALDQIVQEGILKLLQKLQKDLGVTYIFITHDIATVKAISDEIVVMYQGEVVEQGLKSKILNPPHPEYTELLLSSVPEMDPDWLTNLLNKRSS